MVTRAFLIAACLSMASLAGCGRIQAYEQQKRIAERARAERPKPAAQRVKPARTLHIRAYADADYRAEQPNWRAAIAEVVEMANLLAGPQLDLSLELDGSREWQRECEADDLPACVRELALLDEGAPDTWVVAFTARLPQLSRELDVLGRAEPLGRHIILHGMSRLDEQDAFDMTARELRAAERDALARERRRHKAAVALLHAWGHTLGGLHGGDGATLMHASYTPEQAAFTDATNELLSTMIDGHLRGEDRAQLEATYVRWLEAHPDASTSEERAPRLPVLPPVRVAAAEPPMSDPAMPGLSDDDRALLARALEQARAGRRDVALASAAQLAERYPHLAPLQLLACDLGLVSSCSTPSEAGGTAH
jgi:hypothetical protein